MKKSEALVARRNAIVPEGMGMFSPLTIDSGDGAIIRDVDGREYIDFAGGIGVLNAGHCPKPVVDAMIRQTRKLVHACFPVAIYEPYVKLCEDLAALFPHGKKTKVMLTSTGAEAVENAIKIARQATGRQGIICFTGGFHGRTLLGMTLTSKVGYKIGCGPFAPEVYRFPFPDYYQRNDGLSMEEFVDRELGAFENYLHNMVDASQVAAVILELVQGEGGFVVAPKEYVHGLQNLCKAKGILLIVDEVQTGFGRTGKWAAYQHYDIVPDISTWAKSMGSGMPIGAVIGKAEIMDKTTKGTLGGTYPGNPVACAAAIATIEYMKEIDIEARGAEVGKNVKSFFLKLQKECPAIGEVRGLGAMVAFELVKDNDPARPDAQLCKDLMQACAANGLLLISAGVSGNVIRVLSPLVIRKDDLMTGLQNHPYSVAEVNERNQKIRKEKTNSACMTTSEIIYRKEVGGGIVILNTQPEHAAALEQLQRIVFPTLAPGSLMRREHYLNHIRIFPEGQFVALSQGQVIGMTTTIRYHLPDGSFHTFEDVLDSGFLNTHEPNGEWMYGMDIGTHPDFRGKGIATYLYDARQETVRKLGLRGQFTYGMLSGYGALYEQMTAEDYYLKVAAGKMKDPTVSRQMKNGFKPHGLVAGYVEDPVCRGYCAFLIRENESYKEK